MSLSAYQVHANGIQSTMDSLGDSCPTFIWNDGTTDRSFKCLPSGAAERNPNSPGGFTMEADLRLTILCSHFGLSAEQIRDAMVNTVITYRGQARRVDRLTIMPGGLQLRLECLAGAQSL